PRVPHVRDRAAGGALRGLLRGTRRHVRDRLVTASLARRHRLRRRDRVADLLPGAPPAPRCRSQPLTGGWGGKAAPAGVDGPRGPGARPGPADMRRWERANARPEQGQEVGPGGAIARPNPVARSWLREQLDELDAQPTLLRKERDQGRHGRLGETERCADLL